MIDIENMISCQFIIGVMAMLIYFATGIAWFRKVLVATLCIILFEGLLMVMYMSWVVFNG